MKKISSLLVFVTIIDSSILTTLNNNIFTSTKLENNNTINNLKSDDYPKNINRIENWYLFVGHNRLIARISHNTWQNFKFKHDIFSQAKVRFSNTIFKTINSNYFIHANHSGDVSPSDYISTTDLNILVSVIIEHYNEIDLVFMNKKDDSRGIVIRTNRASFWDENDKWWGVHVNNGEY